MKLRAQLSLASLALLVLPWTGCQYVREMESVLREGQANAMLATARAIAAVLSTRADLVDPQPQTGSPHDIYAHRFPDPVQLDGFGDDWETLLPWAEEAEPDGRLKRLAATDGRSLYLWLEVSDSTPAYRALDGQGGYDHLLLSVAGHDRIRADYQIAPAASGWVTAERLNILDPSGVSPAAGTGSWPQIPEAPQPGDYPLLLDAVREVRIHGMWRERAGGYTLELALPLEMASPELGLRYIDGAVRTGHPGSPDLGRLIYPSADLVRLVAGFAGPGHRIWVVDADGRVLARAGEIDLSEDQTSRFVSGWLYGVLRGEAKFRDRERPPQAPRLGGGEVRDALSGISGGEWRLTRQQGVMVLSAALPLEGFFGLLGAIVVEQADRPVAAFADLALTRLFGFSFVALFGAGLVLFAFASVLSLRIRRLHKASEVALTSDGRLLGDFPASEARDELGDLARSFARLLSGLRESTDYLRSLGSKLSHELRTPLAVVRSSLENLDQEGLSEKAQVYAGRAREGADRLSAILGALSEASRIESAIRDTEPEIFNLHAVVKGCIDSYRDVYRDRRIEARLDDQCSGPFRGAPDLIAQLLDKLMDNAADFSPPQGWIRCSLECDTESYRLIVENEGPPLPEQMRARLFDSMVSLRASTGPKLHLGLGLYIARLVAEYHAGNLTAENLSGVSGVRFIASLRSRD